MSRAQEFELNSQMAIFAQNLYTIDDACLYHSARLFIFDNQLVAKSKLSYFKRDHFRTDKSND